MIQPDHITIRWYGHLLSSVCHIGAATHCAAGSIVWRKDFGSGPGAEAFTSLQVRLVGGQHQWPSRCRVGGALPCTHCLQPPVMSSVCTTQAHLHCWPHSSAPPLIAASASASASGGPAGPPPPGSVQLQGLLHCAVVSRAGGRGEQGVPCCEDCSGCGNCGPRYSTVTTPK